MSVGAVVSFSNAPCSEHGYVTTSSVRYAAADGREPAWTDFATVPDPHALRSLASHSGVERRVYALDYDSGAPPDGAPGAFALFLGFTPPSTEEMLAWHDGEHFTLLRSVPGWVRTRRYRLISHKTEGWGQVMLLHEWASADAFASDEFERMIATPWRARILRASRDLERRILSVYKT